MDKWIFRQVLSISKENRNEKGGSEKSPNEAKGKGSRVAQEEDRGAGRNRQLCRERKPTRHWALCTPAKTAVWGLRKVQS